MKRKILPLLVACILVIGCAGQAYATNITARDTLIEEAPITMIYDLGDGNFSFTIDDAKLISSSASIADEDGKVAAQQSAESVLTQLHAMSNGIQSTRAVIPSYHDSVYAYNAAPFNDGTIQAQLSSDLYIDSFPGYEVTVTGTSYDFWSGFTPSANATNINANDVFTFSTFGFAGLTLSYPPGLNMSTSSNSMTLTYPQITNQYSYYHSYNNIKARTSVLGSIYWYTQSHGNTFLFGNKTVSNNATDNCVVW